MAEQIKEVIKQEYVKCAQDPAYFMKKYCMIQHPIKGKIPFELYDYEIGTHLSFYCFILIYNFIILKIFSKRTLFIKFYFSI